MATIKPENRTSSNRMRVEEWRIIPTNWRYSVSNIGRVMRNAPGRGTKAGRILRLSKNGNGYLTVALGPGARTGRRIPVHVIVAFAFLGSPTVGYGIGAGKVEINHKDGNRLNNNDSNLEWVTRSENAKHAYSIGLVDRTLRRGSKNWQAKLSEDSVFKIRAAFSRGTSSRNLARIYNVSRSTICGAIKGRSWAHIPMPPGICV